MKLPPDYHMASLGDLRRVVSLLGAGNHVAHDEQLEMTETQYGRYKQLVYAADVIRFYQGMAIKITATAATSATDSLAPSNVRGADTTKPTRGAAKMP